LSPARRSMRPSRSSERMAGCRRAAAAAAHGHPCQPPPIRVLGEGGSFLERVFAELDRPLSAPPAPRPRCARAESDHRGKGVAALITQLLASGEPVLVLTADALARRRHLGPRLGGFGLASYDALGRDAALPDPFAHLVLLDPPTSEVAEIRAASADPDAPLQRLYLAWDQLSYALQHTYTSGSTVSAIRSPRAIGRFATVAVRPGGSSRRSCVGRHPSHRPPNMRDACCGSSPRSVS